MHRTPDECNWTTEVAVLLTLYVALAATHAASAWQIVRRQHCRKCPGGGSVSRGEPLVIS